MYNGRDTYSDFLVHGASAQKPKPRELFSIAYTTKLVAWIFLIVNGKERTAFEVYFKQREDLTS